MKKIKRIVSIMLIVALTASILPVQAFASASPEQTGMLYFNADDGIMRFIDGMDNIDAVVSFLNEDDKEYQKAESKTHYSGAYAWNSETNTLTLSDFEYSSNAMFSLWIRGEFRGEITLELIGNNTLTSTSNGEVMSAGVYVDWFCPITVTGTGTLTARGGDCENGRSAGIYVDAYSHMTVESGTINAYGGSVSGGVDSNSISNGLYVWGTLTIGGGVINVYGGDCPENESSGISAEFGITMNGGTVYAEGKDAESYSNGLISFDGSISINGGTLTSKGHTSAFYANHDFIGLPGSHVKFPSSDYAVWHSTEIDYEPSGIGTYSRIYNYSADDKYVSIGLFAGESNLTRAEFTDAAVKALGLPVDGDGTVFTDVPADAWYAGAVGKAYEYGLISGIGGGRFDPDRPITRQEAMVIVYNMAKIAGFEGKTGSITAFDDADSVSEWALGAVQWNVGSGMLADGGGRLNPASSITRGESAVLILELLRAAGIFGEPENHLEREPAFLSSGYELKEFDMPHVYKSAGSLDISQTTVGQVTVSNLRVIESDDAHEAKEGWEWRIVDILYEFNDENFKEYGAWAIYLTTDYYSFDLNEFHTFDGGPISINYNGEDITIESKSEVLQNEMYGEGIEGIEGIGDSWIYAVEQAHLVPAGYDGLMIACFNTGNYIGVHHGANRPVMLSKLIDEDTLFFRLD